MHRTHAVLILCFISIVGVVRPAHAQQDTTAAVRAVRIELQDGTSFTGIIVAQDDTTIHLRTAAGAEISIPKAQVKRVEPLDAELVNGRFLRLDPNRTRLLLSPTARPLRVGEGYFADYEIFLPFAAVGVLDRVSIGGGISIVPGVSTQAIYLAPKVTMYDRNNVSAAVGALYATTTDFDGGGGLVYGLATVGSSVRAFTVGAGFAYWDGHFDTQPAFVLGGEYQVSNNVKLLSENYVVVGADGAVLLSAAIRFFGDRLAADLGLFTSPEVLDEGGFPFAPLLSFAYNFGR